MRNNPLLFRKEFMMDRIKDARHPNENLKENQIVAVEKIVSSFVISGFVSFARILGMFRLRVVLAIP